MRIANNSMAINTHRQYTINNANVATSTEKLSSGYRINRAGDDAAGLAISEKMRAQIKGLNMASKNSQDAISLIQTAEGALTETHSILQRMRELSVQASSDTNDEGVDRAALNEEFQALKKEIDDIAAQTKFNGKLLLNGDYAGFTSEKTNLTAAVSVSLGSTATTGSKAVSIGSFTAAAGATAGTASDDFVATADLTNFQQTAPSAAGAAYNGTYTIGATVDGANVDFTLTGGAANETIADVAISDGTISLNFGNYGTYTFDVANGADSTDVAAAFDGVEITIAGGADANALSFTIGTATFSSTQTSGEITAGVTLNLSGINWAGLTNQASVEAALFTAGNSGSVEVTAGETMTIQTGADQNEDLEVTIGDMRSEALEIDDASIETRGHASNAITTVNTAINTVSTQRAKLGAYQNRLQHKINNLDTSAENLQAAESRIRDLDMAKEMTTYTKNNILVQASTAMLAQANAAPQGVLQLLQ